MPTFLLIRHGENDYVKKGRLAGRMPDIHLNDRGRSQANELVSILSGLSISAVYSSPLERAIETATPIAERFGIPVITSDGLIEVNSGEWQGKKISGLHKLKEWKLVQLTPSLAKFPCGETIPQAQFRIVQELENLSEKHEKNDILVCVSHADPIRLAVAFFSGIPLDLFQRLMIAPASITTIEIGFTATKLIGLNYTPTFKLHDQ